MSDHEASGLSVELEPYHVDEFSSVDRGTVAMVLSGFVDLVADSIEECFVGFLALGVVFSIHVEVYP